MSGEGIPGRIECSKGRGHVGRGHVRRGLAWDMECWYLGWEVRPDTWAEASSQRTLSVPQGGCNYSAVGSDPTGFVRQTGQAGSPEEGDGRLSCSDHNDVGGLNCGSSQGIDFRRTQCLFRWGNPG